MESPERITGDKMLDLLDRVKMEKTILKLNMPGAWNEWLSIVVDIKPGHEPACFVIDFPGGPRENIMNAQGQRVIIEFTGKDRIRYTLRSVIKSLSDQNIYIRLPEAINRLQRRGFFRISSPIDTKVTINNEDGKYEFNVINISESGALISQPTIYHDSSKFFKGALKSLSIVCKDIEDARIIKINKAEIRRVFKRPETGCYEYALMFLDRGRESEKDIRKFIYSCQRKILYRMKYPEEKWPR
jgi:c-di-GMP-binding flagellar brake protein YcgR